MEATSPTAATSGATHPPGAPRLLLVEDDPPTARALAAILGRRGLDVRRAGTVAEATAALEGGADYMILDLMLPDGDGADLLSRVRREGLPVKVIVTTGSSDSRRLDAVSRLAPDALLGKPIDLDVLLRALDLAST